MLEFSWRMLVEQVGAFWEGLRAQLPESLFTPQGARELVRLSHPVEPFNQPELVAPVVGLAGLLLGLVLAGVAVGALGTLLVAVIALALLLTRVYGVSLEIVALGR
ncbi:MAG: hypothetical protein FJ144_08640 [Deltaproteobacteria bacterium]|nr:hypothetical protein [Deltaproteobacteria bacterium]